MDAGLPLTQQWRDLPTSDIALIRAISLGGHAVNGVPAPTVATRRRRAAELAMDVLKNVRLKDGLVTSPLGPEWSSDVDMHVSRLPFASDLRAAGWLPLDDLLTQVGHSSTGRWAATESGEVVGAIDLHLGPPDVDPQERVFRRCLHSGYVRLRDVLELRALRRQGLLSENRCAVLTAAASAEAALGGSELAEWNPGDTQRCPPTPLPYLSSATLRRVVRHVRDALRPRLVVAISGVDGSGKSTLTAHVHDQLLTAGVPSSTVWARPGNGLRTLAYVAQLGKRILGQRGAAGVEQAAAGERPLRSQSRALGLGWTALVTAAFLSDAWRQHLRGRGVVVWDRHVLDALATYDFAYAGPDVEIFRAIARRCLPRATLTIYLDVPRELAVSRNAGDILGNSLAVERQVESYRRQLVNQHDIRVLDARLPLAELTHQVLTALTTQTKGRHD